MIRAPSISAERSWPSDFRKSLRHRYQGRRVLVVGADGFLGYNTTSALYALGAELSVLTRRPNSGSARFARVVFFGDFDNPVLTRKAVRDQSVVFDCVGSLSAVTDVEQAAANFEKQCLAHIACYEACAQAGQSPVIVFPSTRLVYGAPQYRPVDEKHALDPASYYARSRLKVEQFLKQAHSHHGLRARVLRLSNPYGPNLGTSQTSYNVITRFAQAIARGERVKIFGDGKQLRDYVHVYDVVKTFLVCGADESDDFEVFNLGGAQPIMFRDAVHIMVEAAGGPDPEYVPWPELDRKVETGDYVSDIRKLNDRFDLPPFVAPQVGLREVVDYYRDQQADGQPKHAS